jgi:hypothetical protein
MKESIIITVKLESHFFGYHCNDWKVLLLAVVIMNQFIVFVLNMCGCYSVQKFIICDARHIVIKYTSSENDGPSYSQQLGQWYVGSNHRKDASKFYKKGVGQQNNIGSKNDASSDNAHTHQYSAGREGMVV